MGRLVSPLYQQTSRPSIIPPGLAEHLRPTIEATLTAEGTIHRITAGPPPYPRPLVWKPETLLHTTFFRVQQLNRENSGIPGLQPSQTRQYRLTAPLGIPELQTGERGDIIRVSGREFRVQQVLYGSVLLEVDIICTDNLTQQNPV